MNQANAPIISRSVIDAQISRFLVFTSTSVARTRYASVNQNHGELGSAGLRGRPIRHRPENLNWVMPAEGIG